MTSYRELSLPEFLGFAHASRQGARPPPTSTSRADALHLPAPNRVLSGPAQAWPKTLPL